MIRDCIICEADKDKEDMEKHTCPYVGRYSVFNLEEEK